jgi:hypothetical protein
LVPSVDTIGYGYEWYWDGVYQPGWEDVRRMKRNLPVAGTYTLRVDQILLDTVFTTTKTIVVPVTTNVSGPPIVEPWVSNLYQVSATGGTAPYTYSWTVDGTYYGSGSSINTPAWNQYTEHDITVSVTDANAATGYAELHVFTNHGCDPQEPGCNIELRALPAGAKSITPAPRRPVSFLRRP